MTIREFRTADARAVRSVLLAAFPGKVEADLVERLRADGDAAIELVAEEGGRIVGHIVFSPVEAPFRALALAPVAVLSECQRGGIGASLIAEGHRLAAAQGWRAIFVLGEPAYYRRFGYDPALASGFSSPYAGEYFMALALDGPLPANRGAIRHAPAFAEIEE